MNGHVGSARQHSAAKLRRQVLGQTPAIQDAGGRLVHPGDDDLCEGGLAVHGHLVAKDFGAFLVLAQAKHEYLRTADARSNVHAPANRAEAEQSDAVLPRDHLRVPFEWRQLAPARTADVGGNGAQRLLASQFGQYAFAVVANGEAGDLRSRPRSSRTCRALASMEFCTSSAMALRGSLWLRASQRMRSKESAGFSSTRWAPEFVRCLMAPIGTRYRASLARMCFGRLAPGVAKGMS
jgi:hypothetical protein